MEAEQLSPVEGLTQLEVLGGRLAESLTSASLPDQAEARDAQRYAARIRFGLARVKQLRERAQATSSLFEAARLDVALTILDGHVSRAAWFVDTVARRQKSEIARANRQIEARTASDQAEVLIREASTRRAA